MSNQWDVFLNCPFDKKYVDIFWGIVFTIHDCGFVARCSLELDDASGTRIDKLYRIIKQSAFGIHDISRTDLDTTNKLPRFNMPLELGIFLGAKQYDAKQRQKKCLILDTEQFRYQKFCSDIAGQDIKGHGGKRDRAIIVVRDWLRQWIKTPGENLPGGKAIVARYKLFKTALPVMCEVESLDYGSLPFIDHHKLVIGWLKEHPQKIR